MSQLIATLEAEASRTGSSEPDGVLEDGLPVRRSGGFQKTGAASRNFASVEHERRAHTRAGTTRENPMKLYSIVRVDLNKHEILQQPGVLARLRHTFGGDPQLATGKLRAALEAAMLIEVQRRALAEVGANDAVALVVDELVLFADRDRLPNDLGDLFLRFHEHAPAIDADFRVLRLIVDHLEAGVHYAIEMQARTEDSRGGSPVRVIISGRVAALEPRKGEPAEGYRARVEPLLRGRVALQLARASFDSFVTRVGRALARSLPGAHISVAAPGVAATAPDQHGRDQRPEDRDHDPHEAHDLSPMLGVLGLAMLGGRGCPGDGSLLS